MVSPERNTATGLAEQWLIICDIHGDAVTCVPCEGRHACVMVIAWAACRLFGPPLKLCTVLSARSRTQVAVTAVAGSAVLRGRLLRGGLVVVTQVRQAAQAGAVDDVAVGVPPDRPPGGAAACAEGTPLRLGELLQTICRVDNRDWCQSPILFSCHAVL